MARYQVEVRGQRFELDAPDDASAVAAIKRLQGQPQHYEFGQEPGRDPASLPPGYDPKTGEVTPQVGAGSAAVHGFADWGTSSFADEAASYLGSTITGEDREKVLSEIRDQFKAAYDQHPVAYSAGGVGGAIAQAVGLSGLGLSAGANIAARGGGLGRIAMGSAADGAMLAAASGAGSGTDTESRLKNAALNAPIGLFLGLGAPYAMAGAEKVLSPLVAPFLARLNPEKYAQKALETGVSRSGKTPDQIADALQRAIMDDQPMFTVADAMGHAGQRMVSTAARNPHPERQFLVETLDKRQAGQGKRIAGALQEAFGVDQTALKNARETRVNRAFEGNINYGKARREAGAVDTSGAIEALEQIVSPGLTKMIGPGASNNSVYGTLTRMRNLLTDGRSQVSDFDRAFLAKLEMDKAIEAGGTIAGLLGPVKQKLDDALAAASKPYATARDAYRADSKIIEAIDEGRRAATRGRSADTIPAYRSKTPQEQRAYRGAYGDKLIEQTEGAAVGVNKARPLISDATEQEFPAFSAPGKGSQLGRRISREQKMFEMRNAATGNSKTADNLADAADISNFDPSVLANLLAGRIGPAIMQAGGRALAEMKGLPPSVLGILTKDLMETNPAVARAILSDAGGRGARNPQNESLIRNIILNLGAGAAGRLTAQ